MIAYVCVVGTNLLKLSKVVKEGGSKGCKNGWVSLQHRVFIYFFPYSFAFTLFDFFLLYKKFTPNSTTSSNVTRALKAS
jgi:hypothetical protein